MLYKFGRFLQVVGMIVVPFAIAGNVLEKLDLKDFLLLAAVGMAIFTLGWLVQQSSRPQ